MKKRLLLTLLLPGILLTKAQTFNASLATMLQDTLNTYVAAISNIKGMSASVYIPGQGIWKGVAGLSHAGTPITSDMRFGIASNSKLFVATIMLKLAERGVLSLNDSLSKWVTITNSNINPNIRIRQLLNHTSGISDPIFLSPWMDTINRNPTRVFTPNEVLSWVGAPLFAVGTSYGYSNINYIIAGMIAQNATGFHISRLIRDSILTPLNMDSTFYDVMESSQNVTAHRWWNSVDYHDTSRVGLNSAGGCAGALFSTSSEMAQWYTALFNRQIISLASLSELATFVSTGNATYQYGLGLSRETTQGRTYWGHGGSTWGYRSKIIYDSCLRVTVCGLTNSFPSGMDGVTFLLYRAVVNHIPGCSSPISGASVVCRGTTVTYSVPAISRASSYNWVLPSGATGSSNSNSITVTFGATAVSGTITVTGVNAYGTGGSSSLAVTVNPKPNVGFTVNNATQILSGNSFSFVDTTAGTNTRLWNFGDATTNTIVNPAKSYSTATIYTVKLRVTSSANCSDSITKNVTVLPNAPTTLSSSLSFSNITSTNITLTWTNGNGQRRIVLAKAGSIVNANPQNGIGYTANAVLGSGSQLGSGNYVIYKGTGNTVTLTGLNAVSPYYFAVIEMNGDTTLSSYQSTPYLTGNQTTLPVKWLDFTARLKDEREVILNWSTASETNNSYFTIERAGDNLDWSQIGKVKGNGTTNTISSYQFSDTTFNPGLDMLLYRLKQVDVDGKYEYSKLVWVDLKRNKAEIPFMVYPNPNEGVFTVDFNKNTQPKTIRIFDMTGKRIKTLLTHDERTVLNLESFGKGLYLISVKIEEHYFNSKVLVE